MIFSNLFSEIFQISKFSDPWSFSSTPPSSPCECVGGHAGENISNCDDDDYDDVDSGGDDLIDGDGGDEDNDDVDDDYVDTSFS